MAAGARRKRDAGELFVLMAGGARHTAMSAIERELRTAVIESL
jgi:hypothetical protein